MPNDNYSYHVNQNLVFKKRSVQEKNFLWVGRRWSPILGYISKFDEKKGFQALMG